MHRDENAARTLRDLRCLEMVTDARTACSSGAIKVGLSTQTPIVEASTLLAVTDRTIRSTAPSKPRVIELIARS